MAQLEVGDVGVIRFGDKDGAKVVHELDQPLTDDAAARVLAGFSFDEFAADAKGTPFASMLRKSLDSLRDAKGSRAWQANSETLQLLLMVSDGRILEDHKRIQRLVREAAEQGVLPVLVLLDYFAPKGSATAAAGGGAAAGAAGAAASGGGGTSVPDHSILDMKSVSYVNGKPKITMKIDDYPLPYYILLRDMHALPSYLGDALRQWFELVAGQSCS
jgi:midasin